MIRNGVLKSEYLRLSNAVRLRKEYFGGLVFHGKTGTILEVDSEAYQMLYWLKQVGTVHTDTIPNPQVHAILPTLLSEGIIVKAFKDMLTAI